MARETASEWRPGRLALQLFALTSFALAQPLFDILGRTPEFLLVRHADVLDVVTLVAAVTLGPAVVLWLFEATVGLLGRRARIALHLGLVAVLGALCALPPINRNLDGSAMATLGLAGIAGLVLASVHAWSPGLRAFLTWLAPAGLVFPALFLLRPSTRAIVVPPAVELRAWQGGREAPVVMIVFDEFPLFALTDASGQIDATLFPNFARLARDGTWFRNATTIATTTPGAVAGILTGAVHGPTPLGNPWTRSRNLFTLLGAAYDLHVTESYVPFCPPSLCGDRRGTSRRKQLRATLSDASLVLLQLLAPPAWAARLPDLTYATLLLRPAHQMTLWEQQAEVAAPGAAHFRSMPGARAREFERFIASIEPSSKPVLHYLHILAPHMPYVYQPSGKVCDDWRRHRFSGWWYLDADPLVLQQRLLMQVGWVDAMVGRLLDHLDRTGLYAQTLLVLVADHGISFRHKDQRRALTKTNGCDVLGIPLFIKAPHQREGGVSDRNVEVIDVLPTIASLLGIEIPWPVDGQSAFGESAERPTKTVVGPSWPLVASPLGWKDGRLAYPPQFGIDCLVNDRPNPGVSWGTGAERIFRVGPYGELLGHEVRAGEIAEPRGLRVRFIGRPSARIPRRAAAVPCVIEGQLIVPGGAATDMDVVVAINGTIAGVGRTRAPARRPGAPPMPPTFMVPVPASAFHRRRNDVRVFVPRDDGGGVRLVPTNVRPGTHGPA